MTFRHFILTRYSLRFERELAPEWFARRLPLFRDTAASVARQTAPVTWLIFYSPEYELAMLPLYGEVPGLKAHLIPVYNGNFDEANAEMRAAMAAHLTDESHVISTRLDNDDLIAPDFCDLVQREFAWQERAFVNFDAGRNRRADGTYWRHVHRSNMFQSLIEARAGFQGIFTWAHRSTELVGPVIHLAQPDRWVHVEHADMLWPLGRYEAEPSAKEV